MTTMTTKITSRNHDAMRRKIAETMEARGTNPYRVTRACGMHDDQLRGWLKGYRPMIRSDLLARVMDHLEIEAWA